jgi:hypothetical protein
MHRALCLIPLITVGQALAGTTAVGPEERNILLDRIREWQRAPEVVPLEAVVEALSGCRILDWQGEGTDGLIAAADAVVDRTARVPLVASRPNEVGNQLEGLVAAALGEAGWGIDRPAGPSGRRRSAGYPDLEARAGGHAFYIEIKAFSPETRDSSQRSFYLSPSADFKVTRDAFHLLVACEIIPVEPGSWAVRSVRWLDLHRLDVRLKHEFNASNRDLYGDAGLVILETTTTIETTP